MAANPALWADIRRDLATARENAEAAVARARTLEDAESLPEEFRLDREYAIGTMLHNAYGAMESALERLIQAVDGTLPTGPAYHADLVRRAALAVEGLRPPMISPATAADLHRLRGFRHVFRHAYDGFDFERAAENVPVAGRLATNVADDLTAFAVAIGIAEPPS